MGKRAYIGLLILLAGLGGQTDNRPARTYSWMITEAYDQEMLATAGIGFHRVFEDYYLNRLRPGINPKRVGWTDMAWQAWWSYFYSLWPHELGHKARARDVGGDFLITFAFPFPRATMDKPDNLTGAEEMLPILGGFEVNYLIKTNLQEDYYQDDRAHALDLIHNFIQTVYFPFYTIVVAPQKVNEAATWTDTRGDPVEYALNLWNRDNDVPAVSDEGKVNPDIKKLYREIFYVNLLWTLVDPQLYLSARGFSADVASDGLWLKPWSIGSNNIRWAYSTVYNASPLGPELQLYNYLHINDLYGVVSLRYGWYQENLGIGLRLPGLVNGEYWALALGADAWQQEYYDGGFALRGSLDWYLRPSIGIGTSVRYKTAGYLLGNHLGEDLIIGLNISYVP